MPSTVKSSSVASAVGRALPPGAARGAAARARRRAASPRAERDRVEHVGVRDGRLAASAGTTRSVHARRRRRREAEVLVAGLVAELRRHLERRRARRSPRSSSRDADRELALEHRERLIADRACFRSVAGGNTISSTVTPAGASIVEHGRNQAGSRGLFDWMWNPSGSETCSATRAPARRRGRRRLRRAATTSALTPRELRAPRRARARTSSRTQRQRRERVTAQRVVTIRLPSSGIAPGGSGSERGARPRLSPAADPGT